MKKVEVYFKNENDAESAKAELNKYSVRNIKVEKVPEGGQRGSFMPVIAPGSGAGGVGVPFSGKKSNENPVEKADPKYMSHMLLFEVAEEDYDETIAALKDFDSYQLQVEGEEKKE